MTTADPVVAKLDQLFAMTDTDRDGHVDWNDYRRIIDRYLEAYAVGGDDPRAHALTGAYRAYWSELLRHADGAERLDREAYHRANRAAGVDGGGSDVVEGVPHAVFALMDGDGDGAVDRAEFTTFLAVWGVTGPEGAAVFDRLDADGDGVIGRQEYLRAVRAFFHAPEADSAGDALLGQLGR
ncbi:MULTISPECIES: EF-hand domain-containing protein [unclassified Streptomyces]|uniref:EF-hand domain-containing protein n=1 Tax=unclassified Streptomyces TaxID=2593676 RepID=UPI00381D29D7